MNGNSVFSVGTPRSNPNAVGKWYRAESYDVASTLSSTVSHIGEQLSSRRRDDELFMKMFGSYDISGMGESLPQYAPQKSLRFNLVKSATLTAQAHIGASKPFPAFVTSDADWELVKKARACEQAIKGVFHYTDFYQTASDVFLDATVASLGAVKVYLKAGRIHIDRVFPGELLVDVQEGLYGKPQNLYQVKLVDTDALAERFPKLASSIPFASTGDNGLFSWIDWSQKENLILVIEGWHLPSWDAKKDKYVGGRHVIATQNTVLVEEEWKRDTFPFAFYRWGRRLFGFYGYGIVEQLREQQRTINRLDSRINSIIHNLSVGHMVVWDNPNARVNTEHLTNSPLDIIKIKGTGQPPTIMSQNAVPTELWQMRQETIQDGYNEIGINEMQSRGERPKGVDSAVALREVQDAGSRRFRPKTQAFEGFVLETARLVIRELHDASERGDKLTIQAKKKRGTITLLEQINWKEVALKDEEYRLELVPRSSLPDSSAGRKQTVEDWYRAGFIDAKEARYLLEFPDLDRFNSLDLSAHEIILDSIEVMIEDGEYVFPEPTDDLELLIKLTTQSYNKFRLRKLPDDRLELLRRYIDDAKALIERAQTEMAPQGEPVAAPPGMGMQGAPTAVPPGLPS